MKPYYILIIFLFIRWEVEAQTDTLPIAAYVTLDSFVVTAVENGFDVRFFINKVVKDESFYQAFKNIRTKSYSADNRIMLYDKKNKLKADYKSTTRQLFADRCRTMEIISEQVSGDFYKKEREYKYYTAELFDKLFFTHGRICQGENAGTNTNSGASSKNINRLKTLIFKPGQEVDGVPFIGHKTAIFSEKMARYYDYSITSAMYENRIDCYVFTAKIKPEFEHHDENDTVIKYLETYFDKSNYQVVARDYQLKYDGLFFSFDVTMNIELTKVGTEYLPVFITYDGIWDVPAKKPEKADFQIYFNW